MPDITEPQTSQPIAPIYAPEASGNPFVADTDHDLETSPLGQVLSKDFKRSATVPFDFLRIMDARASNIGAHLANTQFVQHHKKLMNLNNVLSMGSPGVAKFLDGAEGDQHKFLSPDEWKESQYFRKGIDPGSGITVNLAQMLAQQHDKDAAFNDEQARVSHSTWADMAQMGAQFSGALVNTPIYTLLAAPLEAGSAGEMVANSLSLAKDSVAGGFVRGGVEGGILNAEAATIDYGKREMFQEPADPAQIFYQGLSGALFGGSIGAAIPVLKSAFGKKLGLEGKGQDFFKQAVTPEAHEAMLTAAVSQMDHDITPNLSEYAKKAYFEKQNSVSEQLDRASGQVDDNVKTMEAQRDLLNTVSDRIDEQLEKETNPEELEALKSDKTAIERQISNHDTLIEMAKNPPEDVTTDVAKAYFSELQKPTATTTFNTNEDVAFEPSADETIRQSVLDEADNVTKKFNEIKESLPKNFQAFGERAETVGNKLDATKSLYDGIRKCLLGGG